MQVLGGRVDTLAEAWEAQQKYSGLKRMTKAEISSMGPVFSLFDPTTKTQPVKGNFSMDIQTHPAEVNAASTGKRQQPVHVSSSAPSNTPDNAGA